MDNVYFTDYEKHITEYLKTHSEIIVSRKEGTKMTYYNYIPMGFDIETYTNYKKENGKVTEHFTNMYVWQFSFGVDNMVLMGRTWEEFSQLITIIKKLVCANKKYFTICFIHNMSFEFSFMATELAKRNHSIEVFARKRRKPMKTIVDNTIIFLDSYLLTGYSLKLLAKNFTITQKLEGESLGYNIPRHSKSILTEENIKYCVNDVLILAEFSQYYYNEYLTNSKLPMTKTMIANNVVKEKIKELNCKDYVYYLMKECYPKDKEQYEYFMSFYTGAYTHGMLCNLFTTIYNCLAYDVNSEYPYVMMSKYYPVSKFRELTQANFTDEKISRCLSTFCCLVECRLHNIKTKTGVTIISKNKIFGSSGYCQWDNGRLYSCDGWVEVRITEVDIETLKMHYDFDIEYLRLHYAKRGYLPNYLRLTIAELYNDKTQLKGVKGKETEYAVSKQKLNGIYGACACRLTFENLTVGSDGRWKDPTEKDLDFSRIWRSKDKLPQFAIWITSHSRKIVLEPVARICSKDRMNYIYTDTDSIKCRDTKEIRKLFNTINTNIRKDNQKFIKELDLANKYPNTDFSEMGCFALEHDNISRFKTLGSKRYITELANANGSFDIETTVAGLPKRAFLDYCERNNLDPFDTFTDDGIDISDAESQKLCAYYEDNEKSYTLTDVDGITETITATSFVSLIPTSFSLKVTDELKLLNIKINRLHALKNKESET